MKREKLIIGIGNPFRGDDGVGIQVARQLLQENLLDATVKEATGEATALMSAWEGFTDVTIVDAISVDGHARGDILTFEPGRAPLPSDAFTCSTHSFGLNHAIELSRALGTLPQRLQVIGIVGTLFDPSESMEPGLEPAIIKVVNTLKEKDKSHA